MSDASISAAPTPEAAVRWLTGRSASSPVAAATAQPSRQAEAPEPADVEAAVARIAAFVSDFARELQFRVDDASGRTVITVRNSTTDEVVRQIPSEEVLALAARIAQTTDANGILMQAQA
jgi:flagellar protein FlaG